MSVKPRIIYISSASPVKGPGTIGWGHVQLLKEAGFEVDMLTLYKEPTLPEVLFVQNNGKLRMWGRKIINRFFRKRMPGQPHFFFYQKETEPPIPARKVVDKITKKYDLVMVYFWQGMLSFQTVEAIYDKLDHPVVYFISPDYSHMSGGCHFTCDCLRYQTGCGCCPAIDSNNENDFTHENVLFRERFYEKVKPVVFGNSYMNSFYQKSYLLKKARLHVYPPTFNVEKFKPVEIAEARKRMGIISDDAFVIAFGCQALSDPRKGIAYLIESLSRFKNKLSDKDISRIQLLVAGSNYEMIKDKLPFRSVGQGLLSIEELSYFYSAANIFACPSVDDAGPSMVAQSIACGTPVVGFKMGAMLDFVLDKGTGYCAELKDCDDFVRGLESFFRMSKTEYDTVSKHCHQYAMDNSNNDVRVRQWMDLYLKYRER